MDDFCNLGRVNTLNDNKLDTVAQIIYFFLKENNSFNIKLGVREWNPKIKENATLTAHFWNLSKNSQL